MVDTRKRAQKIRQLTTAALLAAFAAILGYVDALLPVFDFLPIPGIKLGLANLAVLLTLEISGFYTALAVSLVRILLVNLLLFPSSTALVFSFVGGMFALCGMVLLKKLSFHTVTISVFGSICHNLAQTAAAVLLLGTPQLFLYLIFLLPVGCLCGALLGVLAALLLPRLKRISKKEKP